MSYPLGNLRLDDAEPAVIGPHQREDTMPKNFGFDKTGSSSTGNPAKYIGRHRRGRTTRASAAVTAVPAEAAEVAVEREPALAGCS
ncbi:hypothetical protein FB566_2903 [Stackebrandtia endophytica]|uniref:Uncharacterized protein n=1 Tax=Stackebrandtia endophytica TaxID=1496996 RepID=A0A543AXN8_9ACTN|nr:hypothetical protein [Stackebrandtia endophytica]TQL77344.1 hypothetical protein FB566_2903 [Stackebrandtia endophytica]